MQRRNALFGTGGLRANLASTGDGFACDVLNLRRGLRHGVTRPLDSEARGQGLRDAGTPVGA